MAAWGDRFGGNTMEQNERKQAKSAAQMWELNRHPVIHSALEQQKQLLLHVC
jgi:hypothetical protein